MALLSPYSFFGLDELRPTNLLGSSFSVYIRFKDFSTPMAGIFTTVFTKIESRRIPRTGFMLYMKKASRLLGA
jgi:hypothetical protein